MDVVCQMASYGGLMLREISAPFAKKSTWTICPSGSDAVAINGIGAPGANVAASAGLVNATMGGVFNCTVMLTGGVCKTTVSVELTALARNVYGPDTVHCQSN